MAERRNLSCESAEKGKATPEEQEQVMYRVIHKSLQDFRTRLPKNQDRHGRKEHINR